MKHILIINADLYKSASTDHLISAYIAGAKQGLHQVRVIAIADMLFNFNKQFPNRDSARLEPDLSDAWDSMIWSDHIVLFCPVFAAYIPSKVSGFFERLFNMDDLYRIGSYSLYGRSGRIVSILDQKLFMIWSVDRKPNFMAVKKTVFEQVHISPVHTATIGELHSLDNDYSGKWTRKMYRFGQQGI